MKGNDHVFEYWSIDKITTLLHSRLEQNITSTSMHIQIDIFKTNDKIEFRDNGSDCKKVDACVFKYVKSSEEKKLKYIYIEVVNI